MIINKLRLRNFGQHEDLQLEFNGPVIGILGQNGKGKSTIAQAIVYAFLGDLPTAASECIRHGEKQLRVDCEFTKGGISGSITRTASKDGKATRSLVWGNDPDAKPITRAKDVDIAIEEILGADKQTILNSVFIAQGDIANIVKATSSKRIELLVKLLNLNYLNKRANALDDTIKKIEKSVVPIEPLKLLKDKANLEFSKLQQGLNEKIEEVDNKYGSLEFVQWILSTVALYESQISKLNNLLEVQRLAQLELSGSENNFNDTFEDIVATLNFDSFVDLSNEVINCLRQNIALAKEDYSKQFNEYQKFLEYNALIDQYKTVLENLNEFEDLKNNVFNGIEFDDVKTLQILLEKKNLVIGQIKSHQSELATDEATCKEIIEIKIPELINRSQDLTNQIQLNEANKITQISILANLKNLLETKIKIKESFEKSNNQDASTCPLCGLKLQLGQTISERDLEEIQTNISYLDTQLTNLSKSLNVLHDELNNADSQIYNLNICLKENAFRKNRLNSFIDDLNKDPIFDELKNNKYIQSEIDNEQKENQFLDIVKENLGKYEALNKIKLQQDSLMSFIENQFKLKFDKDIKSIVLGIENPIYSPDKTLQPQEPNKEQIVFCEKRLEDAIRLQNDYLVKNDLIDKRNITIQTIQEDIQNSNESFSSIEKQLSEFKSHLKATKLFSSIQNLSEIKKICNEEALVEYQEIDHIRIETNLKQQEKDNIENQISELETKNANIYQRLSELNAIKSLINPKEGITKQYLQYLFKILSKYVSEYLLLMDANFIIKIDFEDEISDPKTGIKENGLSYQFKRIDKADDYWLNMNRLSSGQKVKLSIAILIAIQKLICPDLNFLVLDEPSNSLDEPSVEALGTLLGNLGRTLSTNEGQIFIVDHNQILNRAFTTTVNL